MYKATRSQGRCFPTVLLAVASVYSMAGEQALRKIQVDGKPGWILSQEIPNEYLTVSEFLAAGTHSNAQSLATSKRAAADAHRQRLLETLRAEAAAKAEADQGRRLKQLADSGVLAGVYIRAGMPVPDGVALPGSKQEVEKDKLEKSAESSESGEGKHKTTKKPMKDKKAMKAKAKRAKAMKAKKAMKAPKAMKA